MQLTDRDQNRPGEPPVKTLGRSQDAPRLEASHKTLTLVTRLDKFRKTLRP
jgi:hypothetical protein